MAYYFISDLHLEPKYTKITNGFKTFLSQINGGDKLFILGDFFEYWIGDDFENEYSNGIKAALKALVEAGVEVYFTHGNRDFLIGEKFAQDTGVALLPSQYEINIGGKRILLLHGDELCIDDIDYMKFRAMVRDENWQKQFLSMPLDQRIAYAQQAREKSQENYKAKSEAEQEITDVNLDETTRCFDKYDVDWMIHGHTHRPNIHSHDELGRKRIVLGDWYTKGWYLKLDENQTYASPPELVCFELDD